MEKVSSVAKSLDETFKPGAIVLLSLSNPREKFWGVMLQLSTTGVGIRGVDLASFDETLRMVRHKETIAPAEVFFPLHRLERIDIDAPSFGVPSLRERFEMASGANVSVFLQF